VVPERLQALAQAWQDPSAWRGTAEVAEVSMPAEQMGLVALDELVMHGWDLARATGQEFTCDAPSAQAALAFTARTARPGNETSREGLFGPVVPIPKSASPFDRPSDSRGGPRLALSRQVLTRPPPARDRTSPDPDACGLGFLRAHQTVLRLRIGE